MRPRFREDKTTQAAAVLIELSGGKMNYYILLKLLYMADRAALTDMGQPITFDCYYSMSHGPVLSTTYDLLKGTAAPDHGQYWNKHISEQSRYEVTVTAPTTPDKLSDAEINLLRETHARYGHFNRGEFRRLCHATLAEWQDPHGSATPIEYEDILRVALEDETDAEAIRAELDLMAYVDETLAEETV
ncbi:MAG TPA: Panacea domain-containing protein [Anaerolineae bacterium]|nr:Panacea domain-containing protein [Anaerolineae bacterium]